MAFVLIVSFGGKTILLTKACDNENSEPAIMRIKQNQDPKEVDLN